MASTNFGHWIRHMTRYGGLEPWSPVVLAKGDALSDQQCLRSALQWAILAPSGHNTQPWVLHEYPGAVEVVADYSKRLPIVDPQDRELIMSCAALTTHLELALTSFERAHHTTWFPAGSSPDVVARVEIIGSAEPTSDDMELFDAIPHRITNRAPFRPLQLGVGALKRVKYLVENHGAHLTFLSGVARSNVGALIAKADRLQMADKAFRNELASWVHHNHSDHLDGMRGYAFGVGDLASHVGPTIIRTFDAGKGQAAKDHQLATHSPQLVLIETDGDTRHDWVNAGRAMDLMLLYLTAHGYAASFLNQPIEVASLRVRLARTVASDRYPQLLLRIGEPSESQPHSPRRPLHAVLT